MAIKYGIDLGGTKIEGVVLNTNIDNPQNFQVIARHRVDTNAHLGYEAVLSNIINLVKLLENTSSTRATDLGIGTPGSLDPATGTLKNSNTQCLNGKYILNDLEQALSIPVKIANDANCFALAEATLGIIPAQYPKAEVVFGVIMGTGVGGGLVVNGKVLNGLHGIGGEWGHNFLDESGGPCYCGRVGCVETILSGPNLEKFYFQLSGENKKLKDIYSEHLANSNPFATQTIERLISFFGKALGPLLNIIDPDAIIIGGGVGNIDLLYTEGKNALSNYIFNKEMNTPILAPSLGDSAGVFGAAMLV